MQTKLHINVPQGIIDIEGDPDLVREVYADFRDRLLDKLNSTSENPMQDGSSVEEKKSPPKQKRRPPAKKAKQADADDNAINQDNPKLDKNLDLSQLRQFYDQYDPKNNSEKILVDLVFT